MHASSVGTRAVDGVCIPLVRPEFPGHQGTRHEHRVHEHETPRTRDADTSRRDKTITLHTHLGTNHISGAGAPDCSAPFSGFPIRVAHTPPSAWRFPRAQCAPAPPLAPSPPGASRGKHGKAQHTGDDLLVTSRTREGRWGSLRVVLQDMLRSTARCFSNSGLLNGLVKMSDTLSNVPIDLT